MGIRTKILSKNFGQRLRQERTGASFFDRSPVLGENLVVTLVFHKKFVTRAAYQNSPGHSGAMTRYLHLCNSVWIYQIVKEPARQREKTFIQTQTEDFLFV